MCGNLQSTEHDQAIVLCVAAKPGLLSLQDETVKYKAALRTRDIFAKQHSVEHDIITGRPLVANYIMPSKPAGL